MLEYCWLVSLCRIPAITYKTISLRRSSCCIPLAGRESSVSLPGSLSKSGCVVDLVEKKKTEDRYLSLWSSSERKIKTGREMLLLSNFNQKLRECCKSGPSERAYYKYAPVGWRKTMWREHLLWWLGWLWFCGVSTNNSRKSPSFGELLIILILFCCYFSLFTSVPTLYCPYGSHFLWTFTG